LALDCHSLRILSRIVKKEIEPRQQFTLPSHQVVIRLEKVAGLLAPAPFYLLEDYNMSKGRLLLVAPILFCSLLICSAEASAQGFGFGPRIGGHYAGGRLGIGSNAFFGTNFRSPSSLYSLGYAGIPPQFALHPPVYYSAPVARPYGYSPFPLPAGVSPAEPFISKPIEIENPYFAPGQDAPEAKEDKKKKAKPAAEKDSVTKIIVNPYYVADPSAVASKATNQETLVLTELNSSGN
jgi:hypothetical protein